MSSLFMLEISWNEDIRTHWTSMGYLDIKLIHSYIHSINQSIIHPSIHPIMLSSIHPLIYLSISDSFLSWLARGASGLWMIAPNKTSLLLLLLSSHPLICSFLSFSSFTYSLCCCLAAVQTSHLSCCSAGFPGCFAQPFCAYISIN